MSWRNKFKEHTTNIAFQLSLSGNMVRALEMAHAYHHGRNREAHNISYDFGRSVPSIRCLINRGLVEHHDMDGSKMNTPAQLAEYANHRWYTLTPAGDAVYQLCVIAGLITPVHIAANEAVA
jgi:hypothetical protein